MTQNQPPQRVPEERVGAILTRAAEIDRKRRDTVDLEAIRSAAVDAGISLAAVDRALEEYAAGATWLVPEPQPARSRATWRSRLRGWLHKAAEPLKYGALGVLLGLLGGLGEAAVLVPFVGLLIAAFRLVLRDRPTHRARAFLISITLMTVGAFFGLAATLGDEDVLAVLVPTGLAVLAAGTAAIKWVRSSELPLEKHV